MWRVPGRGHTCLSSRLCPQPVLEVVGTAHYGDIALRYVSFAVHPFFVRCTRCLCATARSESSVSPLPMPAAATPSACPVP